MNDKTRRMILRIHAWFLLQASIGGLVMDIAGAFFGKGPEVAVLRLAPEAALGFTEAHGLALVLAVLMLRAVPART